MSNTQLKSYVERIEKLEEEKRALASDIKDIYNEADGQGIDKKALREVIKLRRQKESERKAVEELVDVYMVALGMN